MRYPEWISNRTTTLCFVSLTRVVQGASVKNEVGSTSPLFQVP